MASNSPYPLFCKPVLKSKIWGGRRLESLFGAPLPAGEAIGEAWIVADLPQGCSSIANGNLAGEPLSRAARAWGEALIGPAWRGKPTGGRFPLLVKFLDAQDDLSVQVHPDEEACRLHFPKDFSKDESWVVLAADAGGSILHGFHPQIALEDFDREIARGGVANLLRRVQAVPGQVFRVAPRTVHALCRGVAILEIQEPSDSTFRIYDYDRPGDDGKPRALHLDAARKVMRFGDSTPPEVVPVPCETSWGLHEILVDTAAYRIERLHPRRAVRWQVDSRSAQVVIVLSGSGVLRSMDHEIAVAAGDSVILPACAGSAALELTGPRPQAVLAGAAGVAMAGGA